VLSEVIPGFIETIPTRRTLCEDIERMLQLLGDITERIKNKQVTDNHFDAQVYSLQAKVLGFDFIYGPNGRARKN